MWTEFVQSFTLTENRTWARRRYLANVAWLGVPPPPGTPVQIHEWGGHLNALSAEGALLGIVQTAINPARAGLVRAQVAQEVSKIDITYLGPDDLSAA
jgi:hypothetical protein